MSYPRPRLSLCFLSWWCLSRIGDAPSPSSRILTPERNRHKQKEDPLQVSDQCRRFPSHRSQVHRRRPGNTSQEVRSSEVDGCRSDPDPSDLKTVISVNSKMLMRRVLPGCLVSSVTMETESCKPESGPRDDNSPHRPSGPCSFPSSTNAADVCVHGELAAGAGGRCHQVAAKRRQLDTDGSVTFGDEATERRVPDLLLLEVELRGMCGRRVASCSSVHSTRTNNDRPEEPETSDRRTTDERTVESWSDRRATDERQTSERSSRGATDERQTNDRRVNGRVVERQTSVTSSPSELDAE
ncbi:Hypothetical protein SMAX5B_013264 [Scophthalmus maximus]|uniref:Uncharacterized protein n=1 Tax=Scophthalmus maximus TaxID=52904 RepID=A0A2U9CDA0_SCOMX|nr:Hypothetical protein SMAX5B_013264 [Scophthalmus maximus]